MPNVGAYGDPERDISVPEKRRCIGGREPRELVVRDMDLAVVALQFASCGDHLSDERLARRVTLDDARQSRQVSARGHRAELAHRLALQPQYGIRALSRINVAGNAHFREANDVHSLSYGILNTSGDLGKILRDPPFRAAHLNESDSHGTGRGPCWTAAPCRPTAPERMGPRRTPPPELPPPADLPPSSPRRPRAAPLLAAPSGRRALQSRVPLHSAWVRSQRISASIKSSIAPSITAAAFPVSQPVRRSLMFWY